MLVNGFLILIKNNNANQGERVAMHPDPHRLDFTWHDHVMPCSNINLIMMSTPTGARYSDLLIWRMPSIRVFQTKPLTIPLGGTASIILVDVLVVNPIASTAHNGNEILVFSIG